jgi:DNA-binding response OmpR family regulator
MVLYIDDDEHYAWLIKTLLGLQELDVTTAHDGLEGLRKARELQPDLILIDMYLPRIDGVEVIQRLRSEALTGDIPIVVMSALPEHHSRRLLQDLCIQDVVCKPFHLNQLTSVVRKHLRRRAVNGRTLLPTQAEGYPC